MRTRTIATGGALLTLCAGIAGLVGVAESSQPSAAPEGVPGPPAKVQAPTARQRAALKAFARPERTDDRMPAPGRANVERGAGYGENPELSRQVLRLRSGHRLYMVPAAGDLVGIYDETGGGGVTDLAHIATGESHGVDICAPYLAAGWIRFHGQLPSDASDVELIARDGTRLVPVLGENAWATEVSATPASALPTELRFTSGGLRRTVTLQVPDDVGSGRCHRDG